MPQSREVGDEHPGRREPDAREEGHGEQEAPALAEGTSQRVSSQEPDAGPQGEHKSVVLDAAGNPLAPEPQRTGFRVLGFRVEGYAEGFLEGI